MPAAVVRLYKLAALVEQPGEVKRSHAVRVVLPRGRCGRSCLAQNERVHVEDVSRPRKPSRVFLEQSARALGFG